MERIVRLDNDGNLEVDGVKIDLNMLLDKIDMKPTVFTQVVRPLKFKLADFWYNPAKDIFSIGRFVNKKLYWVKLPFGVGSTEGTAVSIYTVNNLVNGLGVTIAGLKEQIDVLENKVTQLETV